MKDTRNWREVYIRTHAKLVAAMEQLNEQVQAMAAPDDDSPIDWGVVGSTQHALDLVIAATDSLVNC